MPSIINSDDGQTSGSAGLKFTSGDDGVMKIQNNGVDAMTVSAAGQPTFAAPVSQPGAFMFRNKLINGNFDIWQRGTSQTSSGYGSADRWPCGHSGSTKTASQQAFALGQTDVPNNPNYFMRNVVTSSAGASNYSNLYQLIEGVETLSGKTATFSFWAKADASKNIAIELFQYFGTGGSPSAAVSGIDSQLVALTTSWTKYTITVDIPSVAGKTIGTNNNDWLGVTFWFDAGSNFNDRTASLGQQSGTFDIAQVQLEEGSAATPFEQRPYGMELSLCQRYYQTMRSCNIDNGAAANTKAYRVPINFSTAMRVAPTITFTAIQTVAVSSRSALNVFEYGFVYQTTASGGPSLFDISTSTADAEL